LREGMIPRLTAAGFSSLFPQVVKVAALVLSLGV
jgi:hypothetical protein